MVHRLSCSLLFTVAMVKRSNLTDNERIRNGVPCQSMPKENLRLTWTFARERALVRESTGYLLSRSIHNSALKQTPVVAQI